MGDLREDRLEADLLQTRGPGDTRSSLVTRGAILSSHWSGGILPRRESVREIRRVRSCGVTSVETMRRGGDAHLQKGEIFSLTCKKNISVNTSKVFEYSRTPRAG